ncbi:prepilin peptidase [Arthrobacter bussei]|uniref:Prepilin peptidase n=1 Tax=Arthrobacter bussei TaxID=2594179 RepID=A0A7X1TMQ2_9MICC|nr:prepilin peptidase [Arthrobacter bussei]
MQGLDASVLGAVLAAVPAAVLASLLTLVIVDRAGRDPRTVLPPSGRVPLAALAGLSAACGNLLLEAWWDDLLVTVFATFAVVLGAIDARTKLLPNALLLPFALSTLAILLVAAVASGSWWSLLGALAGGLGLFAVYLLLALVSPAGMGMGDVKLAAVLGLYGGWAGYTAWMCTLLGGFLLGGLAGVLVLVLRRGNRGSTFPFGPGMLLAAFAGLVLLG